MEAQRLTAHCSSLDRGLRLSSIYKKTGPADMRPQKLNAGLRRYRHPVTKKALWVSSYAPPGLQMVEFRLCRRQPLKMTTGSAARQRRGPQLTNLIYVYTSEKVGRSALTN